MRGFWGRAIEPLREPGLTGLTKRLKLNQIQIMGVLRSPGEIVRRRSTQVYNFDIEAYTTALLLSPDS